MVTTVANVIDRVLRDFLEPGDSQPTRLKLSGAIDDSQTTLTYDPAYMSPEEAELLGPGTIIEISTEEIIVGEVDETNDTISGLTRGVNGTTAAAHSDGTLITVSPIWRRKSIFDSVGDKIVGLWPDLYGVEEGPELSMSRNSYTEVPANVEGIVNLWINSSGGNYIEAPHKLLNPFPPSSTGKAIATPVYYGASGFATYKTRFDRPATEATTLASLNVDEQWVEIIVIGAVAYLINSRDIDEITEEFIDAQLTERQVNVAQSLRERLLNYEMFLRARAKSAQTYMYPQYQVQY